MISAGHPGSNHASAKPSPIVPRRLALTRPDAALPFSPTPTLIGVTCMLFPAQCFESSLSPRDAITLSTVIHSTVFIVALGCRHGSNMNPKSQRHIRASAMPSSGMRKYARIYSKAIKTMFPSSSSPQPTKSDKPSRAKGPSNPASASNESLEVSDVPCYTCRRRHVKCDRTLPTW